jgi:hypothetical protein
MDPIDNLDELSTLLAKLQEKGLVEALSPPGRGQIVTHTLYLPHERQWVRKRHGLAPDASFSGIGVTASGTSAATREPERTPAPSATASPIVAAPIISSPPPDAEPSAPYRSPLSPSAARHEQQARQQAQEPRVTREEFDELVEKVAELEATVEKLSDTIRSLIS